MKRRKQFTAAAAGTANAKNVEGKGKGKSKMHLSGKVEKGSPEHKLERRRYLDHLIREFRDEETSKEAKHQVLANLANFSYDPYNFAFFREKGIVELFVEQLGHSNNNDPKLIEFAVAGLCNCAPDPSLGENSNILYSLISYEVRERI
jgi:hypothetical protein